MFAKNFSPYVRFFFADDDSACVLGEYELTEEIATASFGELNQIINFKDESICIRFQSASG